MNLKSGALTILISSMLITNLLQAESINNDELQSFTIQKHHVDFNTQTQKSKKDIITQYIQNTKLANVLLSGDMKDDTDFKVASEIIVVDIWIQKFLKNVQIDEQTIKSLYDKNKINVAASYKLRNILVDNEVVADKLIASIKSKAQFKYPKKKTESF